MRRGLMVAVLGVSCGGEVVPQTGTEGETSGETSATTASATTAPTASATGGECPVGAEGCSCTGGGACDPGLVCMQGVCVQPECQIGVAGCPCTDGGACDPGLSCEGGVCLDPGGATESTATTTDSTTMSSDTESSSTGTGEELDDWTKRRPVTIGNELPDVLTDVQVLFTVDYDADMQIDFADLRVTDDAGSSIPFWIENSTAGATADVWARVAELPGDGTATLYIYYGNENAIPGSDGDATFFVFDDFDGDDLDSRKWTATGEYTVANGRLLVETGVVHSNDRVVEPGGQLVEISITDYGGALTLGTTTEQLDGFPWAQVIPAFDPRTVVSLDGVYTAHDNFDWLTFGNGVGDYYGITLDAASVIFTHNRAGQIDVFGDAWDEDMFIWIGDGIGTYVLQDIDDFEIEQVLVRRYLDPLPSSIVGAEEDV